MWNGQTIGCQEMSAEKGVEGKCRGIPWNGKKEKIIVASCNPPGMKILLMSGGQHDPPRPSNLGI